MTPRKRVPLSTARSFKKPDLVLPDGVIRRWMLDRRKVCSAGHLLPVLVPLPVPGEGPGNAAVDSGAFAAGTAASCL